MKATTAVAIGVGVVGLIALTGTASAATQQPPATPRKRRRKELPASSSPMLPASASSSSSSSSEHGGSSSSSSAQDLAEQAEDLVMVEVPMSDAPAPAAPAARDVPQEGKPLAWDPKEHPLAANQRKKRKRKPAAGSAAAAVPAAPAKPASPASSTAAAVTAPQKPASPTRTAEQAANELYRYVVAAAESGTMGALGTKGKPNPVVRDAQADMGGLTTDGIYGPATRTRGKKLIGKTFPARK